MSAAKLIIIENTTNPTDGETDRDLRTEEYGSFQLAAHQFELAMNYWANRGSVRRDSNQKFTCTITPDKFWVTVELA